MRRRTFIKGMFFSIPGIYLKPLFSLCANLPEKPIGSSGFGPILVFIGDYGREIMERYKGIQSAIPVPNPCKYIRPDINMVDRFIELDHAFIGFKKLLSASLDASLLVLVFDGINHEDRALAASLSEFYRKSHRCSIIAITPNAVISSEGSLYSLVLGSRWIDYDTHARVLHSFYNVYCGCSGLGNLVCMKAHLDVFKVEQFNRGQIIQAVSFRSFNDEVYKKLKQGCANIISRLIVNACQNTLLFAIIEMPAGIEKPIEAYERIILELHGGFEEYFSGLPHPNLRDNEFRLTLLKLTQESSVIQEMTSDGCIEIPKWCRGRIRASGTNAVIVLAGDDYGMAYDMAEWKDLRTQLSKASENSGCMQKFENRLLDNAHECKCDDNWGILLPEYLRRHLRDSKKLVVVNREDHFEIWSLENWEAANPTIRGFKGGKTLLDNSI